jgi:hypothetical protein
MNDRSLRAGKIYKGYLGKQALTNASRDTDKESFRQDGGFGCAGIGTKQDDGRQERQI